MTTTTSVRFPYGTYRVDEDCIERYDDDYEHADEYPLPTELPLHHPLLQALEGTTSVQDAPAPWWPNCVAAAPAFLRPLLAGLSVEEYRSGVVDDTRWRAFKHTNAEALKAHRLTSPKLSQLLAALPERGADDPFSPPTWTQLFTDRGPAVTPTTLDLVISTQPQHFFNMSNGRGWTSCQFRGHDPICLPGNFYDTGVAVAMLLAPGADIWQDDVVIARLTLRVVRERARKRECIAIGNSYHNDRSAATWLILHLIRLLEERRHPWGFIEDTTSDGYRALGELGSALQRRDWRREVEAQGDPVWIPEPISPPYLDGSAQWTDAKTGDYYAWATQRSRWYSAKLTLATASHLG